MTRQILKNDILSVIRENGQILLTNMHNKMSACQELFSNKCKHFTTGDITREMASSPTRVCNYIMKPVLVSGLYCTHVHTNAQILKHTRTSRLTYSLSLSLSLSHTHTHTHLLRWCMLTWLQNKRDSKYFITVRTFVQQSEPVLITYQDSEHTVL